MNDDWYNMSIFQNNLKSLKATSRDDCNDVYMTEDLSLVISFDDVMKEYLSSRECQDEALQSVDAIARFDERPFFIEFKNGRLNNKETKLEIYGKIKDSLLVFGDITNSTISFTRKCAEFILVYNLSKNIPHYRDSINKYILSYAKEEHARFGFARYKNAYFKDVHTYSEDEFEDFLRRYVQ